MPHFTALTSTDNINPTELNSRFKELLDAIKQMRNGELAQSSPTISSFINAAHNHQNAASGGKITLDAIDAEASTSGQVMGTDGNGGFAWSDSIGTVLGFTDTPSAYLANGYLRINSNAQAIQFSPLAIDSYTLDEGSNYSTTSTTFVNVDGTNLSFTIQTGGGVVWVMFACTVAASGEIANFDLNVDGTRLGGNAGIASRGLAASNPRPLFISRFLTDLEAGEHTISLQWSCSFGGTITLYAGPTTNFQVHPQMFCLELA